MFKYEIVVTSNDLIGLSFVKRVMELAQKGAVLKEDRSFSLRFPHRCMMTLETKEKLESSPGVLITDLGAVKGKRKDEPAQLLVDVVVSEDTGEVLSEAELAALSWNDFREAVGKVGVKGVKRETMVSEYLVATAQKE